MPRAWTKPLFGALCVCLALLCTLNPAGAQTGVAGAPLNVCVLRDNGRMDAAALIRDPKAFDCATPQTDFGPGDYWVISSDLHQRSRSRNPLSARTASLWQERMSLHTLYADGAMTRATTGRLGVTPLLQLGAVVEQPLPRRDAEVVRLLWHVEGSPNLRGILLGARVSTGAQSASANLRMGTLYAAFAGLCIALIICNLALWGALRHRFQLYYCAMTAALLLYALSSSGALAWAFPGIANNDRLRINYLALGSFAAMALIFARSFFEERVFAGWMGRFAMAMAAALFGSGLLFFLMAPLAVRLADTLFISAFLSLPLVVAPTLWRAWRLRSNFLWLFALGWGLPILTGVCRALAGLNLLPWNFWLDNSTILSMTLEVLVSSLAIAYRIKLLREERDYAIASEVLARRLADTDPLTGLLNRRSFLSQAMRRTGEQTLILADLDHFKRVNDTLGHDGGDEVLRLVARMLRTHVPAGALVARIGGEEFAVLCAGTEPVEPEALLARLRATRMPFDLQVTASIGVCRGPLTNESEWKQLYRGADLALFEAKSAGRDRARAAKREAA